MRGVGKQTGFYCLSRKDDGGRYVNNTTNDKGLTPLYRSSGYSKQKYYIETLTESHFYFFLSKVSYFREKEFRKKISGYINPKYTERVEGLNSIIEGYSSQELSENWE